MRPYLNKREGFPFSLSLCLLSIALMATPAWAQRAAMESRTEKAKSKAEGESKPAAQPAQAPQTATSAPTGTLREPTRAEIEVLLEGMKPYVDTSIEGLVPVHHEDGTVSVDLQGRFQNVTIAKMEANGTIRQTCVQSQAEARRFLLQNVEASAQRSGKPAPAPATLPASPAKPKPVAQTKPVYEEK